jgi:hypothetical protein
LAAAWARGVQAGSARVAGCVFEGLRNAGAEGGEARAFHECHQGITDEQIEQTIEAIQTMLAARAGEAAKVIEAEAEAVPSLPAPARTTKAS